MALKVNVDYKDKDYAALVGALQTGHDGKDILVCWHHGAIPELLRALGADPNTVLPGGAWPGETYNWLLVLRYDAEGKLTEARRVVEGF